MARKPKPRVTYAAMLDACRRAQTTQAKMRKARAFWDRVGRANGWRFLNHNYEHGAAMSDKCGPFCIDDLFRDTLVKWMDKANAD